MLDDMQTQIQTWLDEEPSTSAFEILQRLKSIHPDRFNNKNGRPVQRAVKACRTRQAQRIIHESSVAVAAGIT
jgi:hypothetical protein